MTERNDEESIQRREHGGRGPSSFWMHDPDIVFGELRLVVGETFLDMGCGPGDYSIKAAEMVGQSGKIIAMDASSRMTSALSERALKEGVSNIETMTADITRPLAVGDSSVDVCFLSTVLHIFSLDKVGEPIFEEVRRVLKPKGRMVVIECKKEKLPFGPPLEMRLSADEIAEVAERVGFTRAGYLDLGYSYLVRFIPGPQDHFRVPSKQHP